MRIAIVGATGMIGSAVSRALSARGHKIVSIGKSRGQLNVDLGDPESIKKLFTSLGTIDALISAAGSAKFGPLESLGDAEFDFSLRNKLMGQVNLVRFGLKNVRDGGSFTLTSGVLANQPMVGSGAISLVNAGLQGFARAAALEAPRGIRVNVVSPPWVSETLKAMGKDPSGGTPADVVANAYVSAVEGTMTGVILDASK